MEKVDIGIIGGSGLYDPSMIIDLSKSMIKTSYGETSDVFNIGNLNGKKVAFLSRHGPSHSIPPHELNFRANITGLEQLGVKRIVSCCAVGSLKDEYKPGDIVIPDQFIDWKKTMTTFYNTGDVAHVSLADPFCAEIRQALIDSCKKMGVRHHDKGVYVCVEGPRFSTRAESRMFRNFGDVIGMTGVPEAICARERELCLGILATVTDYDSFKEVPVSMEEILKTMKESEDRVKMILREVVNVIPKDRQCICKDAMKNARA